MAYVFTDLIGKTATLIRVSAEKDEIVFSFSDAPDWKMYHRQDCCESVGVEDIVGELSDLLNSPLLEAEEVEGETGDLEYGTFTWTYYKFSTIKGSVNIRWYGESNRYYSETVEFEPVTQ